MHKGASRSTGGTPLDGWNTGQQGGLNGPTILVEGKPQFPMPQRSPSDQPPSEGQRKLAALISNKLSVAVPVACMESKPCMRAFLDYYVPRFEAWKANGGRKHG